MSEPSFQPEEVEENYVLGAQLARGGMGNVLAAEDRKLGREVALKVMSLDAFSDSRLRRRFLREAHVLAQLAHPNIVPIYELVWDHGLPQFYTMKLVKGRTLQEILDGLRGRDPEIEKNHKLDSLLVIFLKICDAVAFAHSQGVIHRDLKPQNIMVGEFGEVLVMDWGLAGLMDDTDGTRITNPHEGPRIEEVPEMASMSLTLDGAVLGTPRYMSPEQAAGESDRVGPASDIFSLGGILYAILTLHPPVDGDSVQDVMRKLSSGEITPPSGFASAAAGRPRAQGGIGDVPRKTIMRHCPGGKVPPALSAVAMRALALRQEDRYADVTALETDINAYTSGFATSAEDIGAIGQLILLVKRHQVIAGSVCIILLLSILFVIRLAASSQSERRSAAVARQIAYSATLEQALASREHHDFGQARRLLDGIEPVRRGFDWRLLNSLCRGDDQGSFRLGHGAGAEPQCLDLLSDGQQLAMITADGHLHIRDAQGGEVAAPRRLPALPLGEASPELQRYHGLTFSPDGKRFAYGNGDILRVLDATSFEILHEETSRSPQFSWLSEDHLLYGFNGSVARPPFPEAGAWVLDLSREKASDGKYPRRGFPEMCAPLAVSPDRKFFVLHRVNTAATSWERRLNLFPADAVGGDEPIYKFTLPGLDYPGILAVSRGGELIAYTGGLYHYLSRSAHVLDVSSGNLLFDQAFRVPIYGLSFDPGERALGLVGGDAVVRLYDLTRGRPVNRLANTYDDGVAFDHSQPVVGSIAHAPPRDLQTRSAQDGRARFFLGHEDRVWDLVFDPQGTMITVGSDGYARRWKSRPSDRRSPSLRLGHMESTYDRELPAASCDGRQVLYFAGDYSHLFDVDASRGRNRDVISSISFRHAPLAVLRDGRLITMFRTGFAIFEWQKIDGKFRGRRVAQELSGQLFGNGRARSGAISDDESRIAVAISGQLISVDLASGKTMASIVFGQRTGTLGVACHDLSPDGRWIASSGFGPQVSIHRFENPDDIVAYLGGETRDFDTAVKFSRDGRLLYTGNEDGRIRVWDTASWTEISELGFPAQRGAVSAIALSNDGELIATSGDDTLKLFPIGSEPGVPGRRQRLTFRLRSPANWIQFARDRAGNDRGLLHSSPGGTLEVWETDLAEVAAQPVFAGRDRSDLPEPLGNFGVVTLQDGRVLVAGGESRTISDRHVALSGCYLYDPAEGSWRETGSLLSPRSCYSELVLLADGRVLAAGGCGREAGALADCEVYDPQSETWARTGRMRAARDGGARILLADGRVLAVGGVPTAGGQPASCELYDPRSGTWSSTGAVGAMVAVSACVRLNDGRVWACGVTGGGPGALQSCELYDPDTATWTPTQPYPFENRLTAASLLATTGEVIVAGVTFNRLEQPSGSALYDPTQESWRTIGSVPRLGQQHLQTAPGSLTSLPDGRAWLSAGQSKLMAFSDQTELYDPKTGEWSAAPALPSPRLGYRTALLPDGKLLLIGGIDENGITTRVEVYDPSGGK